MPMKNPPHPGRLVKDEIEALGLSVAKAAEGLGVTRQQLYRVIKGESAISPDMAIRLEKAISGGADFWLRMQAAYDLTQARVSGPRALRCASSLCLRQLKENLDTNCTTRRDNLVQSDKKPTLAALFVQFVQSGKQIVGGEAWVVLQHFCHSCVVTAGCFHFCHRWW